MPPPDDGSTAFPPGGPSPQVREVIDFLPDAFVQSDLQTGRVVFMNRMALLLFGYEASEVDNLPGQALFAPGEYERMFGVIQKYVGKSLATGEAYVRSGRHDLVEITLRRKDGSTFVAETQSSFVVDSGGRPTGMQTIIRDVTARKEMERRLEELSYRDPLTGCYNRRHLEARRADLERPTARWACVVFDLDNFKAINDTYGHEEGDRVLRGFAHFLARQHRADDVLVRTGGDEFALIVRADSEAEAQNLAERLVEAAALDSPASFSLGVAYRRPGETVTEAMARADRTMYAARGKRLRKAPE